MTLLKKNRLLIKLLTLGFAMLVQDDLHRIHYFYLKTPKNIDNTVISNMIIFSVIPLFFLFLFLPTPYVLCSSEDQNYSISTTFTTLKNRRVQSSSLFSSFPKNYTQEMSILFILKLPL